MIIQAAFVFVQIIHRNGKSGFSQKFRQTFQGAEHFQAEYEHSPFFGKWKKFCRLCFAQKSISGNRQAELTKLRNEALAEGAYPQQYAELPQQYKGQDSG